VRRAELDDERRFLLASLEDLERERAAGDISDGDYQALRDRYTRRAAEVLRALGGPGDAPAAATVPGGAPLEDTGGRAGGSDRPTRADRDSRPRRPRALAVMGVVTLLGALAVVVVLRSAGERLPGQTASGSVRLSGAEQRSQALAQAETLETEGEAAQALQLYRQVLAADPTQVEALSESGWLEFQAGVQAKDAAVLSRAQGDEQAAVRADPGAYAPHLYLGSMLLAEGDAKDAVAQYRQFLADSPPAAKLQPAEPYITRAFTQAGLAAPAFPPSAAG
jgi:tetratricopeptide (TPR) repeat protein